MRARRRAIEILTPLVVFGGAIAVALTHELDGRGPNMTVGYLLGFVAQLVFVGLAFWSASELSPRIGKPFWVALIRLAAVMAVFDAIHAEVSIRSGSAVSAFVVAAVTSIVVFLAFFRRPTFGAFMVGALVVILKAIGAMVVEATLYTWFDG